MRLVFVHWGVPRDEDSSRRSLAALLWLAERYHVSLVPVCRAGSGQSEGMHLPGEIDIAEPIIAPTESWAAARLWPGVGKCFESLSAELECRIAGADWVWIGWWPLARCTEILQEFRDSGSVVTWDWDALSLWHQTAAWSLWRSNPSRSLARLVSGRSLDRFERKYLNPLSAITVPSDRDRQALEQKLETPVIRLRNFIDIDQYTGVRESPASATEPVSLFVGSAYEPNLHGMAWFLKHVWPAVHELVPRAKLRIVGRGITADLFRRLPQGVEVIGEVDNLEGEYAAARLVVCPVWYGGGVQYKVLESGASARPTVITPFIYRCLGCPGFMIASSPGTWQRAIVRLLREPHEALCSGKQAFEAVATHYSRSAWRSDMEIVASSVRAT